jgi:hypothetical protein
MASHRGAQLEHTDKERVEGEFAKEQVKVIGTSQLRTSSSAAKVTVKL